MRVRALDADGDMTFGAGQTNFLVNSAAAVAQQIKTRLGLLTGEWFLDLTDGTPWFGQVIGPRTASTRDAAIRRRVLATPGVTEIVSFSSSLTGRAFSASGRVNTIFGEVDFSS